MHYTVDVRASLQQCAQISLKTKGKKGSNVFHLPKWRPGRYTLQEYERLITDIEAFDAADHKLPLKKLSTHSWEILCEKEAKINIHYKFYCNNSDAGGSYQDEEVIYINGVNLFLYQEEQLNAPCTLDLEIPEDFQVAGGLEEKEGSYIFKDFHQLVDTPFFASSNLIKHEFEVAGIPMFLWFQGDCKPNLQLMEADIRAYTEAQLKMFAEFPVQAYHYLYLMLPYHFRHGVEHYNSTVIAMGPGHRLMQSPMYKSFLEISSHELFHTWNVKALRPADMLPYRYEERNYSRLHYITEGITTYYGDLMLWKGNVWNFKQWVDAINGELRRHYGMGGKEFISLEDASFDSWVNGYSNEGVPNRRISFYTKGNLVSMLTDIKLRKASKNHISLDTAIALLYHRITKENRGYTKEDYQGILEELSGESFETFFEQYISGIKDLREGLNEVGNYMGLKLMDSPPERLEQIVWGLKSTSLGEGGVKIDTLLPGSPLALAGLNKGDEIIAINGKKIQKDLEHLLGYFAEESEVELHFFHRNKLTSKRVPLLVQNRFLIPQFVPMVNPNEEHIINRKAWQEVKLFELSAYEQKEKK
ncbi:MAG: PDZ domain-containing protein [Bacteroidota bacterium]